MLKKFLVILCLLLTFSGCNVSIRGERTVNGINKRDETSFYSSYDSFKGIREYHIKADDELAVNVEVKTTKGSLKIVIYLDIENPIYEGTIKEDTSFTVYLKQAGNYTVKIETVKHVGSYSFDWSE